MLADLTVSLLAGIAIFPAVFSFGFQPEVGPSLLFITIPAIFASLPFGQLFVVLFFVLAAVAATGAMLSILEVPVAFLNERAGMSRALATVLMVVLLGLVGSTAALSNSLLANFKVFGMTMFDLFDFASSNVLLPLGGMFLALFVGWVWSRRLIEEALSNSGQLHNRRVIQAFYIVIRFVTPLLVLLILLRGLKLL
jgi:NSS family neurotransmitter:Na+ symporter